jgi:hypothetical protein
MHQKTTLARLAGYERQTARKRSIFKHGETWESIRTKMSPQHRESSLYVQSIQREEFLMKDRISLLYIGALLCALVAGPAIAAGASQAVDHSLYGKLLQKYVNKGIVDYEGFKKEEMTLDRYLQVLEKVHTKALPRNEQFAFYINAYNAWTIKLILSAYPKLKSIKDLGSLFRSPWKKKICRINGDMLTLDNIEHDILRPHFKDPRVHFAINCASKGCPPLRSEPYQGAVLDRQLDEMASAFINDTRYNRLAGGTLYVSKIFDWFARDFKKDIIGFFMKYAEGDLKRRLEAKRGKIKLAYRDYDWSLNGK